MFVSHLILSITLSIYFILLDFIYKIKFKNYIEYHKKLRKDFLALFIINFNILLIPDYTIQMSIYIFCFFMVFVQHFHYAFFRSYLMPYEIILFFIEGNEIVDTLKNTIRYMFFSIVLFIVSILVVYIILNTMSDEMLNSKYALEIFCVLFVIGIIFIGKDKKNKFLPQRYFSSFRNTYNVIALFLIQELPNLLLKNKVNFKPYIIEKNNLELPQTVIIVMGESLSYKRMSLYGYEMSTTPNLETRVSDNFLFTRGFSSATVTKTSVVDFFNIRREPENIDMLSSQKTNLFKLAKQQGYKTHYVTTQKINIMGNYIGDCDVVLSEKDLKGEDKLYDEVLIDYLDSINFNEKNFIVLHQRNSHSPYEENVPDRFYKYDYKNSDFHTYMLNSYMNSVLYTDYLLNKLFNKVDNLDREAIVFVTSDHGEMLGFNDENGAYGHTSLDYEVAKVPLMIYKNSLYKNDISIQNIVSHYQFSKLIAKSIGWIINNPNEDDTYFINGTDIRGKHGFLKYSEKNLNL